MHLKHFLVGGIVLAAVGSVAAVEQPAFPRVTLKKTGTVQFQADTGALELVTRPKKLRMSNESAMPILPDGVEGASTRVQVQMDRDGKLLGGVDGHDLVLTGSVDTDGDGRPDYTGVLLTAEVFQYSASTEREGRVSGGIRVGDRGISADGTEAVSQMLYRFAPTGGAMVDYYAGQDIGVLIKPEPGVSFSADFTSTGGGFLGALQTVRGACCTFGDFCQQVTLLECDALGGDWLGEGSECLTPDTPLETGRHLLSGQPFGGLSDAGLVLTALDGDDTSTFVYGFNEPGAAVYLDYDGEVAHIYGSAFGGKLVGGAIDPATYEELRIDFAYTEATVGPGGLTAPADALAFGFVVRVGADAIVVFENGGAGLAIDAGGNLNGDVGYFGSDRGTIRRFQASMTPIETCALDIGACCLSQMATCANTTPDACDALSGTYLGEGSSCSDDSDNDGRPDDCDMCPGFDDTQDCDYDWIPDGCEPDDDNDGVPNDCDTCPGFDDGEDCDNDGIPDGCETDCDGNGIPDDCQDSTCPPDGTTRYSLSNHPDGFAAPPGYGLRLDEVVDFTAGNDTITFDFDHPSSNMVMDVTATTVRIYGVAYGGVDTGTEYDPVNSGVWEIDFLYSIGVGTAPGDDDLIVAGVHGGNGGTIRATFGPNQNLIVLTEVIDLNLGYSFRFGDNDDDMGYRGAPGLSGWGWINHPNTTDPAKSDWLFTADPFVCIDDCDNDGIPDECEPDDDNDGVPNDCDVCPHGDDTMDDDMDGVPNACDACPGSDDNADDDQDGVPNGCDICPDGDDNADSDHDGVPDACDICPHGDDNADDDHDGVPNACDVCPGGDDNADSDGDGIPDACDDVCPHPTRIVKYDDDSCEDDEGVRPLETSNCVSATDLAPFEYDGDPGDSGCSHVDGRDFVKFKVDNEYLAATITANEPVTITTLQFYHLVNDSGCDHCPGYSYEIAIYINGSLSQAITQSVVIDDPAAFQVIDLGEIELEAGDTLEVRFQEATPPNCSVYCDTLELSEVELLGCTPDDCELVCPNEGSVSYDMDACWAFTDGSNLDYSEFNGHESGDCDVWGSELDRYAGGHSCTDDRYGNGGDAICIGTSYYPPHIVPTAFEADSAEALRFSIDLYGSGGPATLDALTFYQAAPDTFIWSQPGYDTRTGENNPPSLYGLRILRDGVEIYREVDIPTTEGWSLEEFAFSGSDFEVADGSSAEFEFELYSYSHVGMDMFEGVFVSAWDLDDIVVTTSCCE